MTEREILADIEALADLRPRRVVSAALVAMVPTIVDAELAGVRARFAARLAAERQRAQAEADRQIARAWWSAFEQRRAGKITAFSRSA